MPGLLKLDITTPRYCHEAGQLAMAAARQAQHCRRMWRALDQPERSAHYKAQATDLERRVLEPHYLAQQLPA